MRYTRMISIAMWRGWRDRKGRVLKVRGRMGKLRKNGLSALQPEFIAVRGAIMCANFLSPSLDEILRNLLQHCHDGGEFERVAAECIAKPTSPLVGQ